ncbi:MAG: FtsK/SpoIIIE domain-containing protein [Humibacillus sp.]
MRLRLTVIDTRRGLAPGSVDVIVDAPHGAVFGDLRPLLAPPRGRPDAVPPRCEVNGLPVADEARLGEPPLLRGAVVVVTSSTTAGMPSAQVGLVDLRFVGGPGAGRTVRLPRGEHLVGRSTTCAVRLTDPGASRAHCLVVVGDGAVTVRDLEPANASLVDGVSLRADGSSLVTGSVLRVGSTSLAIRPRATVARPHGIRDGLVLVHVRPRFVPTTRTAEVTVPAEPRPSEGQRLPLLAALAPLVLSGALALAMQSAVMLLFALMSPVLLLGQWWSDRRHGRLSHRSRLREHRAAVLRSDVDLRAALEGEARDRHTEQPDLSLVLELADHRGARLWERRPVDEDWLTLRVGTATQQARTVLVGGPAHDPLTVPDVPVVVDLRRPSVLGLAGARPEVLSLAGSLVTQVATWHSPRCVRIVLLTGSCVDERDWAWASWLPHLLRTPGDEATQSARAQNPGAVTAVVSWLNDVVTSRHDESTAPGPGARPRGRTTDVLVVLDGARELRSVPGVPDLLRDGPASGISFLCIDDERACLPTETEAVLDLSGPGSRATLTRSGQTLTGVTVDLPDAGWLERAGRALAPLTDATPGADEEAVPPVVGFRDLHRACGLDPLDPAALRTSWSTSVPAGRAGAGARALVGMTSAGPLELDLTRDGPHTLIGGTTGSGKSELLRSLVAGLATAHRPDDLTFVLVDYKGGAAFRECARLPHTLGLVTDLDEHLTERALASLAAELRRRERLLAEAGALDLDDYRSRVERQLLVGPRLARLVIVVDEFKMLADDLPDFVDGLVRLAATGRSLGVHLVLATQRPAGIITGDMRTNIALRICLRVRDRADSDDVIECPAAASLLESQPGRAFLRRDGRLVAFQSAHLGGPSERSDTPSAVSVLVVDDASRHLIGTALHATQNKAVTTVARQVSTAPTEPTTELSAFVDITRQVAVELEINTPPSPWLPPLPPWLSVASLPPAPGRPGQAAPFGLTDVPSRQRQETASWDPVADGHLGVVGGARSGRSTLARTLVVGLADRWSPTDLHVHVIIGHHGALADLGQLPHVGSVVSADEPSLVRRVVQRLREELSSPSPGRPSLVVLVIDGWESVEEALERTATGSGADALLTLVRDGAPRGLRVVVTGGRSVGSGRLAGLLDRRLVLHLPDPLDLTLVGLDPATARRARPAGRAVDVSAATEIQVATIGDSPTLEHQAAAVGRIAAAIAARHPSLSSPGSAVPWRVVGLPTEARLPEAVDAGGGLCFGVGGDEAEPLLVPPDDRLRRFLVVGPPRSGRTNALEVAARQLLAHGRTVAVVCGRRGAPPGGWSAKHVLTASDCAAFVDLRRVTPDLAVLVDDADALDGTEIEQALLECARLVDDSGGLVWASAETARANAAFRGLIPVLARDGNGLVLAPTGPTDGDLLRARPDPVARHLPGRGALVLSSRCTPLQVARAPNRAADV